MNKKKGNRIKQEWNPKKARRPGGKTRGEKKKEKGDGRGDGARHRRSPLPSRPRGCLVFFFLARPSLKKPAPIRCPKEQDQERTCRGCLCLSFFFSLASLLLLLHSRRTMSTTTSTELATAVPAPLNRHQRRAQAAIARRAAEKAAAQGHAHQDEPHHAADEDDGDDHHAADVQADDGSAHDPRAARQEARKAAFKAAVRRALRAMMTEYSQDRYGAWWITGLDRVLRNRLHDGFGTIEPDLLALGIVRDAAGGWWRWPEAAPEPVFHPDTKFTRVVPRKPITRGRPRAAGIDGTPADPGAAKEEMKRAVNAAREAEAAAFKGALKRALRALMTDYCQERFDGAWWFTDLDDTLRRRLRAGNARFDADLAHINVLHNSCRGWWTWTEGATEPVFSEDAPRPPRAAKRPAPEGAQARPVPAETTRRKHARVQHKQRPAGAVARGRPAN